MVLTREQLHGLKDDINFKMACVLEVAGKKRIRVKDLFDTCEAALAASEPSAEGGLIMGNPVAELQEKVKFLQSELAAVETKAGIENVFEQGKAQGRVEGASDLQAKLEALPRMTVHGKVWVPLERLTAILEGKS